MIEHSSQQKVQATGGDTSKDLVNNKNRDDTSKALVNNKNKIDRALLSKEQPRCHKEVEEDTAEVEAETAVEADRNPRSVITKAKAKRNTQRRRRKLLSPITYSM